MSTFTKKDIEKAYNNLDNADSKIINEKLIHRVIKNDKMTQAEIEMACSVMEYSILQEDNSLFNIYKYDSCKDYIFKKLYLIYIGNFEGRLPAHNAFGLIPLERKKFEINKLDKYYEEWIPVISKFNHNETLLNDLASETNMELNQLDHLNKKLNWDYRELAEKRKSIILHSKYIYLKVKQFFEANNSTLVIAKFGSREIEINTKSFIHIIFRHYGGATKQFDTEKSFHLDATIQYAELPNEIKSIIELLGENSKLSSQSIKFIPFKYNGIIYSMWSENSIKYVKQKGKVSYIRLKTFYPTELQNEMDSIVNEYQEIKINEKLSGYQKK